MSSGIVAACSVEERELEPSGQVGKVLGKYEQRHWCLCSSKWHLLVSSLQTDEDEVLGSSADALERWIQHNELGLSWLSELADKRPSRRSSLSGIEKTKIT